MIVQYVLCMPYALCTVHCIYRSSGGVKGISFEDLKIEFEKQFCNKFVRKKSDVDGADRGSAFQLLQSSLSFLSFCRFSSVLFFSF